MTATLNTDTIDWTTRGTQIGDEMRSGAAEADVRGSVTTAAFDRLREAGITAAMVPTDFGGGGATHADMGAIIRSIAQADPSVAVTLSMHSHLLGAQIWRHNNGLDASAVFGKVVDGAFLVSTGASDWVDSSGTATAVDGGYRVSARKSPASGCPVGDVLVTSIRWEDAPDGPQVLHCSIPFSAEGVSIEYTWDTMGLRATGSDTVVLDDVFVPEAAVALARPAGKWHPIWNTVLGTAMPLIMAAYVGIADEAVRVALETVEGRGGAHLTPLIGEMINAHVTGSDVVDAMFASSNNLTFANTDEHSSRTLARKTVAADALIQTVRLAMEVTGGVGYTRSNDIERLYRDVHGCLFHPLPRAKQVQLSGRVAQGLEPVE